MIKNPHPDLLCKDSDNGTTLPERYKVVHYQRMLSLHPSCMDPDHPGCEKCWDNRED